MNLLKIHCVIFCLVIVMDFVKADIDLLQKAAVPTQLAEKGLLIDLVKNNNSILTVGERGHIINWQSPGKWQQENAPVSVLLTAVTILSDGTKVAVGHDSAILLCAANSEQWRKVFDGHQLLNLKVDLFTKQISSLTAQVESTEDEDAKEELEYQLEELSFTLDDTLAEQKDGPNKPLLSIAATPDDHIFAVGAYGTLLLSQDKGESWVLVDDRVNNPEKFHLNSVVTTSDNNIYIVGENGIGYSSTDQGNNWASMNMPYPGSLSGISAQNYSTNLVAFGLQGNLMVSNDSGNTWSHKRIDTSASFLGGTIDNDGRAYVVGHGGMVIDFPVQDIEQLRIRKHPSGAAFSKALINNNDLLLVGQFGIISWQLNKED